MELLFDTRVTRLHMHFPCATEGVVEGRRNNDVGLSDQYSVDMHVHAVERKQNGKPLGLQMRNRS